MATAAAGELALRDGSRPRRCPPPSQPHAEAAPSADEKRGSARNVWDEKAILDLFDAAKCSAPDEATRMLDWLSVRSDLGYSDKYELVACLRAQAQSASHNNETSALSALVEALSGDDPAKLIGLMACDFRWRAGPKIYASCSFRADRETLARNLLALARNEHWTVEAGRTGVVLRRRRGAHLTLKVKEECQAWRWVLIIGETLEQYDDLTRMDFSKACRVFCRNPAEWGRPAGG